MFINWTKSLQQLHALFLLLVFTKAIETKCLRLTILLRTSLLFHGISVAVGEACGEDFFNFA